MDVRLPGLDGLSAMRRLHDELGAVPVIIITAYGDLATAVQAVRNGAFEYLVKPFDLSVAQHAIHRALSSPDRSAIAGTEAAGRQESPRIVGSSPAIQEVFKRIAVVAPTQACVHVRGESGTGKEVVARAIHQYSQNPEGPFVPVNVASLSPSLAESELFGHARGAFTGADQARKGLLEQADGGTLFFDEVADIPLSIQVKLLRVLEYGEILPVGGQRPVRSNFRVISATHQNLHQRVVQGRFPRGLVFSADYVRDRDPSAARAFERHCRSDAVFFGHAFSQERLSASVVGRRNNRCAGKAFVVWEHSGVAQRDRTCHDLGPRRGDSARTPAAADAARKRLGRHAAGDAFGDDPRLGPA